MPILLNWAYRKVGGRDRAEDLTQEVLLQIFTAIRKNEFRIGDTEHFVWKIAHYTWCNYLRGIERRKICVSMENLQLEDGSDFAADYAEEEQQKELTGLLGIPMAYIERDLEWLVQREFVERKGSGYATAFPIFSAADLQGEYDRENHGDVPVAVDTSGWAYNGSIQKNHFFWFGMYHFGRSEIEEMMDA